MIAEYTPNKIFAGNPFVEALPPMLAGGELMQALSNTPYYEDGFRLLSQAERLQFLTTLFDVYQPLRMTVMLYHQIYNAIQYSFSQKGTPQDAQAYHRNYQAIHSKTLSAASGGGNSFSVIGTSGIGKSTAIQRILLQFPPVIEHQSYRGQPLACAEIPCLKVETPSDGSVKALCLAILAQVDELVGSSYFRRAVSNRLSGDVLVSQVSQVARNCNIGIIILDEIQNINHAKSGGKERFLSYLVQLTNSSHVSFCLVGVPQVVAVLQQQMHSARRATGFVFDKPSGNEFDLLVDTLWRYQYTNQHTELTPELYNWLRRRTRGIPDMLTKILYYGQQIAILGGAEQLTVEILDRAYRQNLRIMDGFLQEMDTVERIPISARPTEKKCFTIPLGNTSAGVKMPRAYDLRNSVRNAKKDGMPVVDALREWIEEVAVI